MTVTENDIINNASTIAALINGTTSDITIADLDPVTSLGNTDLVHVSVGGADKNITEDNSFGKKVDKLTGVDVDNIKTFGTDGADKDSGIPVKDTVAQYENNVGVIDGDFNFNSSGSTSQTASGYDVFDMWEFDFSGATGTLSLGSHESTSSKPYYASIDITTGDDAVRFRQNQVGNKWSEQTLSVFIRAKYTSSAPTSLTIQFRPDGGSSIITGIISGLTTSWSWLRVDVEVPAYTVTEYTELRLNNQDSEVFDLDIDKIRIVPTGSLQSDGIPSWLDNDEDYLKNQRSVLSYLPVFSPSSLTPIFGTAIGSSSTELRCFVPSSSPIIQNDGTLAINTLTSFLATGEGSTIDISGGTIANIDGYINGVAFQITGLSGITSAQPYFLRGTGGSLGFSFRY